MFHKSIQNSFLTECTLFSEEVTGVQNEAVSLCWSYKDSKTLTDWVGRVRLRLGFWATDHDIFPHHHKVVGGKKWYGSTGQSLGFLHSEFFQNITFHHITVDFFTVSRFLLVWIDDTLR